MLSSILVYVAGFDSFILQNLCRGWVENIKMDLREIEWDGMDWIDLAQDRDQWRAIVNRVMKLWVP
jgi:hypothetical protein